MQLGLASLLLEFHFYLVNLKVPEEAAFRGWLANEFVKKMNEGHH